MQPTEDKTEYKKTIVGYLRRRTNRLAGFVCVCAVGTLFARHFWVAEIIANLRVQLILGLLAVVVVSLILRCWRIAMLVAAVTMWQATWLMPAFQTSSMTRHVYNAASRLNTFLSIQRSMNILSAATR